MRDIVAQHHRQQVQRRTRDRKRQEPQSKQVNCQHRAKSHGIARREIRGCNQQHNRRRREAEQRDGEERRKQTKRNRPTNRPTAADQQARCKPIYEEMEGWEETTAGARSWAQLPGAAVKYVRRIEELIQCPVAMLSTSPEREDTILVTDPFVD